MNKNTIAKNPKRKTQRVENYNSKYLQLNTDSYFQFAKIP